MSLRGLADSLRISKSSCQRILASLEEEEVVRLNGTGGCSLGARVVQFASGYRQSNRLLALAAPIVSELSALTGETCCLYVPVGDGRLPVIQVESPSELRWVAQVGRVYPLYVGAAGKVLLAHMDRERIEKEFAAARAAARGRTVSKQLENDLEEIRRTGVARSRGENIPGVAGAAAVVLDRRRKPVASISIYGPDSRVAETSLREFERLLTDAVKRLRDIDP